MIRHICIFTGTRADYGLLSPLMASINEDPETRLSIVAGGMHLSSEFGKTCNEISADGFEIHEKVEMLLSADSPTGICKSMGIGMMGLSDAFKRIGPDMVTVLGDRFEAFSAAAAAMILNIPLAHIHGGELSFGAIDESMRHAITKMSHLHFTSTEIYRKRVIQMGELPERVFNVGALGVENVKRMNLLDRTALQRELGIDLGRKYMMVTFHPATRDGGNTTEQAMALTDAIDRFPDYFFIITKANADESGRMINQLLSEYSAKKENVVLYDSMGSKRYLSAVKHAELVLGNSSSGIIEAPALKTPTVNIGTRQNGRIKADSVIDCCVSADDIEAAVRKCQAQDMAGRVQAMENPYERKGTAEAIKNTMKTVSLKGLLVKQFYDIPLGNI